MNLVAYSDSEASDTEAPSAPNPAPKPPTTSTSTSKPAFHKVVDRSNPHKIRVNLPSTATPAAASADADPDAPPSKRVRTGGGVFGGLNSFLPAPKRSGEAAAGAAKRGLGKGINLKTGAAPAFSREPAEETGTAEDGKQDDAWEGDAYGPDAPEPSEKPEKSAEDVKLVGKPMMFKPLSVVNKAKKKKKAVSTLPKASTESAKSTATSVPEAKAAPVPPLPKPKVSLFSISQEESTPMPSASSGEYQPMLYISQQTTEMTEAEAGQGEDTQFQSYSASESASNPHSLDNIAADLNLTEAQRRQLFGRQRGKGGSDLSAINVVNFNTDEEYAANEELRASGEVVQHNPLRAIAPGKHSLKQLVSAASTQKDALEEHFATGKRNKKEAGSKYGW